MTTLLLLFGNTSVIDAINRLDNFHYLLKHLSDSFYTLTVECYRGVIVNLIFLVKTFSLAERPFAEL